MIVRRALITKLKEQPRQLTFFQKQFLGFCATSDNDEQTEKLNERLDSTLCSAFLIQIGGFLDV